MQIHHEAFTVGIFGSKGSGKTTYALRFLANTPARMRFIFDYDGEFAERLGLPWIGDKEEFAGAFESGWLCFNPHRMFADNEVAAFDFFCDLALRYSRAMDGRKLVVIDELMRYVSPNKVPKALKDIVWIGRRCGLDGVFLAQQPNQLHNLIREQLTEIVTFRTFTENSLDTLREFKFDVKEVENLPPHAWIARTKWGRESRS